MFPDQIEACRILKISFDYPHFSVAHKKDMTPLVCAIPFLEFYTNYNLIELVLSLATNVLLSQIDLARNTCTNRCTNNIQDTVRQRRINVDHRDGLGALLVARHLHASNVDALLPQHVT